MVSTAGIENVNVGDPVVLLGKQGGAEISADEIARLAETISYEIVTLISQRIPRIYIHNKTISNIGRIIPPQKSAY
jgi:alanine racemase